jgi:rubrerythrin
MAYDFNFTANEIFEMAEQIERNGVKFYEAAAKGIDDADSKKLLKEFADMERTHKKVFAGMKARLADREKADTVFDPEDEGVKYLRALADVRVFHEKNFDLSSRESIVREAITVEKDSIVFYLGMKELVPEEAGKAELDDIIREEMSHITILANKLAKA